MITPRAPIDYRALIENEEVLLIENFYEDLSWLDEAKFTGQTPEEIVHLRPAFRQKLLHDISALFPGTFYPGDAGWIRSTNSESNHLPVQGLHSDHPYLVLSVCLSDQSKDDSHHGTEFYRHREFGFKSIFGKKKPLIFGRIFEQDREDESKWEKWFSHPFRKNTAIVYPGSLLHRMPQHQWKAPHPRLLQIVNFRD